MSAKSFARTLAFLAVAIALAPSALGQIKVVASFSILGDIAATIGGERVEVRSIVGPGADAHAYQPTPADARALKDADIVIVNGLGFEGWFDRLVRASGSAARIVVASAKVEPLLMEPGHAQAHAHGSKNRAAKTPDPHAWQDARNAAIYGLAIAEALAAAEPAHAERHLAAGRRFAEEARALHEALRADFEKIPQERRKIVTAHDAFRYFGRAQGVAFLAAQGVGAETEPTAKDVARLITQIRRERISTVFVEGIADRRVIEQIARETGARIGPTLYPDTLSKPGGPADGYVKMMRHNAAAFLDAMFQTTLN